MLILGARNTATHTRANLKVLSCFESHSYYHIFMLLKHKKKNNSLECDWFRKHLFSTINSLRKLLLASLVLDSLLLNSLVSDISISQSYHSCSLNQPLTIKVVITCVHALLAFVFLAPNCRLVLQ